VIQPRVVLGDGNDADCEKTHTLEIYDSFELLGSTSNYDD
jgi:hypothetical protein